MRCLQEKWLNLFIASEGAQLVRLVRKDTEYKFSTLATIDPGTFDEMLAQATLGVPAAMIVADMAQPGAKLVCVNPAFEELTGYAASEAVGQNCRFLQGEDTEQEAVLQLVESIRAAEPVQLELTNYRKDGSRFRNLLSLQPVRDSLGVYRYSVGVMVNADGLSQQDRNSFERTVSLLPKCFPATEVEGDESKTAAQTVRHELVTCWSRAGHVLVT